MIQVTVLKESGESWDVYRGIEFSGHADYADYGQDIVCAAVSALVLNMANSVETFTDDQFEGEMDPQGGSFQFRFTSEISQESQLLMRSLVLGIQNIEKQYGKPHIIIEFKEV